MARRRRPPRAGAVNELPPLRILGQIAALQSIYYAAALVLMLFTSLVAGTRFSLDLVFGWAELRGDTTQGWLMGFIWLCCAGAALVPLVLGSRRNDTNNMMIQHSSYGSFHRPVEARNRFCAYPPLHPPRRRDLLYGLFTAKRCLVGYSNSFERRNCRGRYLWLPVEGIAAHQFWRQREE